MKNYFRQLNVGNPHYTEFHATIILFTVIKRRKDAVVDKIRMYEEIMTNDDNLESNLLTSILLKMLVQVPLQVELEIPCDELFA